jgi:hypothetical protein
MGAYNIEENLEGRPLGFGKDGLRGVLGYQNDVQRGTGENKAGSEK